MDNVASIKMIFKKSINYWQFSFSKDNKTLKICLKACFCFINIEFKVFKICIIAIQIRNPKKKPTLTNSMDAEAMYLGVVNFPLKKYLGTREYYLRVQWRDHGLILVDLKGLVQSAHEQKGLVEGPDYQREMVQKLAENTLNQIQENSAKRAPLHSPQYTLADRHQDQKKKQVYTRVSERLDIEQTKGQKAPIKIPQEPKRQKRSLF